MPVEVGTTIVWPEAPVKPFVSSAVRLRPIARGTVPFVATPTPTAVTAFGTDRPVETDTDEMATLASLMRYQSYRRTSPIPNV